MILLIFMGLEVKKFNKILQNFSAIFWPFSGLFWPFSALKLIILYIFYYFEYILFILYFILYKKHKKLYNFLCFLYNFYKNCIFFDFLPDTPEGPEPSGSGFCALRNGFQWLKKNQKFLPPVRPPRLCDPTPRPPPSGSHVMRSDTPPPPCRDNRRNTRPAGSRDCRSTPFYVFKTIYVFR